MKRVPGGREVNQAFRELKRALKSAVDALNQKAALTLSKGNYAEVEAIVEKGKQLKKFSTKVRELRSEWSELNGGGAGTAERNERTPVWEFYKPILAALEARGGEASLRELFDDIESMRSETFLPGDLQVSKRGHPRWQLSVRYARKAMVGEGWLDGSSKHGWKLTEQGRQVVTRNGGGDTA